MSLETYPAPIDRAAAVTYWLAVLPVMGGPLAVPLRASLLYREFTLSSAFGAVAAVGFAAGFLTRGRVRGRQGPQKSGFQ